LGSARPVPESGYAEPPGCLLELGARAAPAQLIQISEHRHVGAQRRERAKQHGELAVLFERAREPRRAPDRYVPGRWAGRDLLEVLLRSPGRLLSRQQILAAVWGPGYDRATEVADERGVRIPMREGGV